MGQKKGVFLRERGGVIAGGKGGGRGEAVVPDFALCPELLFFLCLFSLVSS